MIPVRADAPPRRAAGRAPGRAPDRIALLKPCCIGDVIFATPLLAALRRAYPGAAIDWLVGAWSAPVLSAHPALNRVIDCGPRANPAARPGSLARLVGQLRAGRYDLLVVPDRSRWLSVAALLSGTPQRVGLDSRGRGFGYTQRVRLDPLAIRHEAEIYLDLARALGLATADCWANIGIDSAAQAALQARLAAHGGADQPLIVVHPGGGVNPGMALTAKRWPLDRFADLVKTIADSKKGLIIILGSQTDRALTKALAQTLTAQSAQPIVDFTGQLSIPQTAALAALPQTALYVGNDTGLTHVAAAAGARVLAIFGPSDPRRYAPFAPPERTAVAWRAVDVPAAGVAGGAAAFDWARDGVSVAEAWGQAQTLLA